MLPLCGGAFNYFIFQWDKSPSAIVIRLKEKHMKSKARLIVFVTKIFLNCLTIPLYFVKLFRDVAVLPGYNENGEMTTHRFHYYYSIADKFDRESLTYLLWIAITTTVLSIVFSVLDTAVVKDNKVFKIVSNAVFVASIVLFFVLLFIAASIQYNY